MHTQTLLLYIHSTPQWIQHKQTPLQLPETPSHLPLRWEWSWKRLIGGFLTLCVWPPSWTEQVPLSLSLLSSLFPFLLSLTFLSATYLLIFSYLLPNTVIKTHTTCTCTYIHIHTWPSQYTKYVYMCMYVDSEVLIHFDGWGSEYDYWCATKSVELHPPGWCRRHNWELQAPLSELSLAMILASEYCFFFLYRPKLDLVGSLSWRNRLSSCSRVTL